MQVDTRTEYVLTLTAEEFRLVNRALRRKLAPDEVQVAENMANLIALRRAKIARDAWNRTQKFLELYGREEHPALPTVES